MRMLCFDVETTGKALAGQAAERQPRIVQLAALLVDGEKELASLCVLVKPDGFSIPPEVTAIHGITTERASEAGSRSASNPTTIENKMPPKTVNTVFGLLGR